MFSILKRKILFTNEFLRCFRMVKVELGGILGGNVQNQGENYGSPHREDDLIQQDGGPEILLLRT